MCWWLVSRFRWTFQWFKRTKRGYLADESRRATSLLHTTHWHTVKLNVGLNGDWRKGSVKQILEWSLLTFYRSQIKGWGYKNTHIPSRAPMPDTYNSSPRNVNLVEVHAASVTWLYWLYRLTFHLVLRLGIRWVIAETVGREMNVIFIRRRY